MRTFYSLIIGYLLQTTRIPKHLYLNVYINRCVKFLYSFGTVAVRVDPSDDENLHGRYEV